MKSTEMFTLAAQVLVESLLCSIDKGLWSDLTVTIFKFGINMCTTLQKAVHAWYQSLPLKTNLSQFYPRSLLMTYMLKIHCNFIINFHFRPSQWRFLSSPTSVLCKHFLSYTFQLCIHPTAASLASLSQNDFMNIPKMKRSGTETTVDRRG